MAASTEAQKRASRNWTRKNIKQFVIGVRIDTEADLIEHLNAKPNKQQYIKELIRADMAK